MATLQKVITVEITPDKFVDCCSEMELQELRLLVEARLEGLSPGPSPQGRGGASAGHCSTPAETAAEPVPVPATESGQESKKQRGGRRTWTEAETRQLEEMSASGAKMKDMAAALGKTAGAVAGKLHGLKHDSQPEPVREKRSNTGSTFRESRMKDRFLNGAY
jgi:hypothetical protein